MEKESFDAIIRRQLQRTHSQPKLSLPPGTELPLAEVVKVRVTHFHLNAAIMFYNNVLYFKQ